MAANPGQEFDLEKFSTLSRERDFTLEVKVRESLPIRHLIHGNSANVARGRLVRIGVHVVDTNVFQVALENTREFVYRAQADDLRRCVEATERTETAATKEAGWEDRTTESFLSHGLLELTQTIKLRSLSGNPKELLPGTYFHAGSSHLFPNHEIITPHIEPGATSNSPQYFPVSRDVHFSLFQSGFFIASSGAPIQLGDLNRDLTAEDETKKIKLVAWEDFVGHGIALDPVPVREMEEVDQIFKSNHSSLFWCRNKLGVTFVHAPETPTRSKLVKPSVAGEPNIELIARQRGVLDWDNPKMEDYSLAVNESQNTGGPHPLLWEDEEQCFHCHHFFNNHDEQCPFGGKRYIAQREADREAGFTFPPL